MIHQRRRMTAVMILLAVVASEGAAPDPQESDLRGLLDRIDGRIQSYPREFDWEARVEAVQTKMNGDWEPQEVIRVEKIVRILQGKREEEILKAVETKNGLARNITKKYIEDLEKQRRKAEEERAKAEKKDGEDGRGRMSFELSDILPFGRDNRDNFDFLRREDSVYKGKKALILEVRSKLKKTNIWEGLFYFSPETCDLLGFELEMAKNPRFVKEFSMALNFDLLEGNHLVITGTRMKIDGGFFLKKIRLLIEENYSAIRLL